MNIYFQCLNKIKEGLNDYGLSWSQILQFRQLYVGSVDVTLRQLLFTLRQRVAPPPIGFNSPLSPDTVRMSFDIQRIEHQLFSFAA